MNELLRCGEDRTCLIYIRNKAKCYSGMGGSSYFYFTEKVQNQAKISIQTDVAYRETFSESAG